MTDTDLLKQPIPARVEWPLTDAEIAAADPQYHIRRELYAHILPPEKPGANNHGQN